MTFLPCRFFRMKAQVRMLGKSPNNSYFLYFNISSYLFQFSAIRIKTVASKTKEGSSSQTTIKADDNVPKATPTIPPATTTTTTTTNTIAPTPTTTQTPTTAPIPTTALIPTTAPTPKVNSLFWYF